MPPLHFRRLLAVALCASIAIAGTRTSAADAPQDIVAKLAPSSGWAAPEPARVAVGNGLFELIDGGAELYHEFGFKRAVSWSLETSARASIQVELYEMTDAAAAYGVWSVMQSGKFTRGDLGQGSLRFGYYIAFWSGPYFASITGSRADATQQAEVDRIAGQLAALLPRDGALPNWFGGMPSEGLRERKYFRGRIGLSNIDAGPAADLVAGGEGLFASYPDRQILLLHFATEQEASHSLETARQKAATHAATATDMQNIAITQAGADLFLTTHSDSKNP